jgi:hypothetical protein
MSIYYSIQEVLLKLGLIYVGFRGPCETNDIIRIMSNKNILLYDYYLSHDGYDVDGPQSDLYDIFMITVENDKYIYYEFHFENWYSSIKEEIELVKSFELNNKSILRLKDKYHIKYSNNDFFSKISKLV